MPSRRLTELRHSGRTYFIAEIGANHDQSFERLGRLIELAKSSGADAIKLQHLTPEALGSRQGFDEVLTAFGSQISQHTAFKIHPLDAYRGAQIDRAWTDEVASICAAASLDFLSSPYSLDDLEHIVPHVSAIKLGSGELSNLELIRAARETGLPVLLSTGASNLDEVALAVEYFSDDPSQLILMQCNSDYSGSTDAARHLNLRVLSTYRLIWPHVNVGLSDHTLSIEAINVAIGLGAVVVERHFTDDSDRPGADHKIAMEPDSWLRMVESVRRCEQVLGSGVKQVEINEARSRITQRRSLRASRDLAVGDELSRDDISVLRPAPPTGIPADKLDEVVGRKLARPLQASESLTWQHLST